MAGNISLKLGNWLYSNAFGVYNILYPIFKNRQDKHEIEFLKSHVKKGHTVVDIGANIGFYTKILSELAGSSGKVHCFEPDEINFRHLTHNSKGLGNVSLNKKAVSATSDPIRIYHSKLLNVDHRTYPVDEYASVSEIEAVDLDSHFSQGEHVDFIKMDIQGYEIEALKGMKRVIAENPGIELLMEFWPYGLKSAGHSVEDLFGILDEYGLNYRLTNALNEPVKKADFYSEWPENTFTNLYAFKS